MQDQSLFERSKMPLETSVSVAKGEHEDLVEAGVIDPAKVTNSSPNKLYC